MSLLDTLERSARTGLFIAGEWLPGQDRLPVVNPATEAILAEVGLASTSEATAAVDAAEAAAPDWRSTPPRVRGEVLRRAFELMVSRADDFATLVVQEHGKTYSDAMGEVHYAAEFFRWFSEEAVRISGDIRRAPAGDKNILTLQEPVGISLLITPWNFPLAMATRKIGPALAAGCTVVLKPASDTPLSSLAVASVLQEAGVPPGVVNVICARGSSDVVDLLLDDPRVRKLSFTGSTEVGRLLMEKASRRILSVSMELGGNAPFIVFDDADLEAAVSGAMVAKMRNAGEACTAANRFLVHSAVLDQFTERLGTAMAELRVGPGLEPQTDVGPMINARSRADISDLVDSAIKGGASVVTGGSVPDRTGYYYTPTVLADVDRTATIASQEIFGPVAPVLRFETEDEAIGLANDTEYGLISYLYTSDLARGMRVSEALEAGMIGLNRGVVSDPAAPFGGVKQSGIGREGGFDGIREFLETK